jgi:hypothetical protein
VAIFNRRPTIYEPVPFCGAMRQLFFRVVPLAAALALSTPALASAAQSLAVTSPTGFPAGGDPSYTTTTSLDTSAGTPSKVKIVFAPGVLASTTADPSCITGAPQHTSACKIGGGSATILGLPVPFNAYLVKPPSSDDLVGIDIVTDLPGTPVTHAGAALVQTPAGVQTALSFDLSSLGGEAQFLTSMSVTVDGTLNGKPFTRMPTNCSPGHSTLTIAYTRRTVTTKASPDFAPKGCSSLPYAPRMSGSLVRDARDDGVAATTVVTQSADQAASKVTRLRLPFPTTAPNFSALSLLNKSVPVGAATTASALLAQPLKGKVFLTGSPTNLHLMIRFPPPATLTLTGSVNPALGLVSFTHVPDVPVSSLTVALFGGPKALLTGDCRAPSGTLKGGFVGQNGKVVNISRPITLRGCPGKPHISGGKVSGLLKGKPTLGFTLTRATNSPKLKQLTVALPSGLTFVGGGVSKGVSVSGAHRAKLGGDGLNVTLIKATASVSVRIKPSALHESKRLRQHPPKQLKLAFVVFDANGNAFAFKAPI